ncbi:MAG: hypothetical protein AAFV43_06835 [Planctomycetota bacterium]
MVPAEPVEAVIWGVTANLLDGLRGRLSSPRRQTTATMTTTIGRLGRQRVLLASPHGEAGLEPGRRLAALQATHSPRRMIAVGAAAGAIGACVVAPIEGDRSIADAVWAVPLNEAARAGGVELEFIVATAPGPVLAALTSKPGVARRAGRLVGALLARRGAKADVGPLQGARRLQAVVADAVGAMLGGEAGGR